MKPALKYSEARELLGGISTSTMTRMIQAGQITPVPGRRLIPAGEILKFFTEDKKQEEFAAIVNSKFAEKSGDRIPTRRVSTTGKDKGKKRIRPRD